MIKQLFKTLKKSFFTFERRTDTITLIIVGAYRKMLTPTNIAQVFYIIVVIAKLLYHWACSSYSGYMTTIILLYVYKAFFLPTQQQVRIKYVYTWRGGMHDTRPWRSIIKYRLKCVKTESADRAKGGRVQSIAYNNIVWVTYIYNFIRYYITRI